MLLTQVQNLETLRRRFKEKVRQDSDGCWRWIGAKNISGYGKLAVKVDGRELTMQAQRVAYLLHHGELPDDQHICHRCDYPDCVRHDHLFAGTQSQNLLDMNQKHRRVYRSQQGENNTRAKLTAAQVASIRQRVAGGEVRAALAREYKVSWSTIAHIVDGSRW